MSGRRPSDPPLSPPEESPELKIQRDSFVHTFFKKGAEFTEELLRENERLRKRSLELESENASLRTQLASDEAIRDLLRKIEHLERDKEYLLSTVQEQEAISNRFGARYAEMEQELSNLAHLYVASYQLHSTLRLREVLKHLRELLAQLVGARSHAFYLCDRAAGELVPITSEGVPNERLARLPVHVATELGAPKNVQGGPPDAGTGLIERAFLTGVPFVHEGSLAALPADMPAACVPLRIDDDVVGVLVVHALLEQKSEFLPVDFALFKMLGAHAATALMGALLLADADGKLPGLSSLERVPRHEPTPAPRASRTHDRVSTTKE